MANVKLIKRKRTLENSDILKNVETVRTLDKSVSFNLSKESSSIKPIVNSKRKKLLKDLPLECILLGEISFITPVLEKKFSSWEEVQISLLINDEDEEEKIDLYLEIFSNSLQKIILGIESLNDFPWKSISDLLLRNYLWIIKDFSELYNGIVSFNIGVLPEKMPIAKAKSVVELLIDRTVPDYDVSITKEFDCTDAFFKELQICQRKNLQLVKRNVQNEKLRPTLCSYQARAVEWMMKRESYALHEQDSSWLWSVIEKFTSNCGKTLYYNKYSQHLFVDQIVFPPLPRGGILADEMGLGKTVAVIALMLNNPRSANQETEDDLLMAPTADRKSNVKPMASVDLDYFDEFSDVKAKNKESYLNPHEKLIHTKHSKGASLKRALNEWYESALAEYSASSPAKIRRVGQHPVKCVCGEASAKKKSKFVKCPMCERLQHDSCVGFKKNFLYFCPFCWSKQKLIKSNATLIISPSSIYEQWFDEIKKHVTPEAFPKGILMYDSLKNNFIQPSELASYDVVISTYTRLGAELNHANLTESYRKLRNEERFLKQCSPLTQVQWWRLCLDEAQMVEKDCSQINQMAKLIPAVNRWSVTGTPIQKSINDIFYLIDCMKIEPFTEKTLWNSLLYLPYITGNKIPLYATVCQILWRNSKEDVSDELIIPEQKIRYHFLKFTAVEQNFYMREHSISSSDFVEALKRSRLDPSRTIDSLDKSVLTKLLNPLLNLRQACSHPLAVKGNKISTKTGSMTLTELFKYLYNKTKGECEDEMRKHIAALNGLAGICCIEEDWRSAVEHYREVLQIAQEYNGKVNVDSLQRIHTLTNLAEVLQTNGHDIPPTLHDDTLKSDAKLLEERYLEKAITEVKNSRKLMQELGSKVAELEKKFATGTDVWWIRIISALTVDKAVDEVLDKISAELLSNQTENKKNVEMFLSKISSPKGIEVMLRNWLRNVEENREQALKHLQRLSEMSCDELVMQSLDCHLRLTGGILKKKECDLCKCENVLLSYECSLFAVSRKNLKKEYEKILDGALTKGSWKAHNCEKILRAILSVGKNKASTEKWPLRDGRNHVSLLEAMKKEFKQLRVFWMSLNHEVHARDEVSMCKLRLRLRLPEEPLPPKPTKLGLNQQSKVETIHIIQHHEVEPQRLKLVGEKAVSKSEFKKKYGTLLYLDNLGKKENANPDPCPICKSCLENEWCVLQCGHSYCIDCIRTLLMRTCKPSINCPICREITKSSDLSFVDLSGREENSDIRVIGEHSTKVEAVVRTLLELKRSDETVKVLIFSTWSVVLNVLAVALQENGISFRRMPGSNYRTHLKEFKDPRMSVTALLLPIAWGSKGLNLIEATRVFLVEPIMNPAEELQALGRVHRIGQTKSTVVHRFLISGTIEEKIHSAVSESQDKWNRKKVTLEDLKNLFDIKSSFTSAQ